MKFDRRLLLNFDWLLLLLALGICLIGVLNIYSAGYALSDASLKGLYMKQLKWVGIGVAIMALTFSIDYRTITRYGYVIYLFSVLCLVLVLVTGYASRGSQRWLAFGGFTFQPSELMKITIILALANYFENHKSEEGYFLRDLIAPILMVLFPFVLVLKQPDLGTGLILLIIFLAIVFIAGVRWKSIAIAAGTGLFFIPLGWNFLKDYQKDRIMTFIDPEQDPLGTGYHIIQSIIAIGSGGLWGKGFLQGTQTQLKFLPEQHTDFIFSAFAEEWGFIGTMSLMLLFLALILWGLQIAYKAKDLSGKLISLGVTVIISSQVIINIGMVIGILPVVGIPLPFMSYGGSAMAVFMAGIGLVLNVRVRRLGFQP